MPAFTEALVTAAAPVTPVIGVGPLAVSVTVLAANVPPWVLDTVFTKVSTGALSSLLMVQVEVWPDVSVTLEPTTVPAVQLQGPAV